MINCRILNFGENVVKKLSGYLRNDNIEGLARAVWHMDRVWGSPSGFMEEFSLKIRELKDVYIVEENENLSELPPEYRAYRPEESLHAHSKGKAELLYFQLINWVEKNWSFSSQSPS